MMKRIILLFALYSIESNRVTCFQSSLFIGPTCRSRIPIASNTISANCPLRNKICQHTIPDIAYFTASTRNLMARQNDSQGDNFDTEGLSRRGISPKITEIDDLDDFLGFIAEDERLCVVKFYASWCKSCHKFGIKYKKLAMKHADMLDKNSQISERGEVRFAEVEYGKSTSLCKSLGIRKLPYVVIHKVSVGKIAEFPCGPKYFDERLVSRLNRYLEMSDEELKFEQKMEGGTSLGNDILSQLRKDANQPSI